jgi:hypothetical protein
LTARAFASAQRALHGRSVDERFVGHNPLVRLCRVISDLALGGRLNGKAAAIQATRGARRKAARAP